MRRKLERLVFDTKVEIERTRCIFDARQPTLLCHRQRLFFFQKRGHKQIEQFPPPVALTKKAEILTGASIMSVRMPHDRLSHSLLFGGLHDERLRRPHFPSRKRIALQWQGPRRGLLCAFLMRNWFLIVSDFPKISIL